MSKAGVSSSSSIKVLIVGAGPTGLGAGYRLSQLGRTDYLLCEASDTIGGLARSYTDDNGFTWDVGGHVLFSHYEEYDRIFEELMQGEYTLNERESWVRMMDTWVPYPFQNNLRYLPEADAKACIDGLIDAQTNSAGAAGATNFGEFIDNVFGDGIAECFMRPYNFKVWAYEPEKLNKIWIGERVAVIDWKRAKRNVEEQLDDFGWGPNNRFKYPLGGTGDFYKRFEPVLGDNLSLNTKLISVDAENKIAVFEQDGSRIERQYEQLVSTMPLDKLVCDVIVGAPEDIREAASRLVHSGGYMVGVGIKRPCPSTKSWMYFPESNCPFYRVTYLSNYSPNMTPDKDTHYSLLCETSFSPDKPEDENTILERTISGLENAGLLEPGEREDIVSTWVMKVGYSYPTPSVERDEILAKVIPWLEDRGIYSRGRFGMWKYEVSNTDHSVMQGIEVVDRILEGKEEQTIGIVYSVTEDGRTAANHERSALAGSGEKRVAQQIESKNVADVGDIKEATLSEEELGVTDRS
ncbi:MAG: FAD-dependent oxidoreductase [Phycisphaerales bacterium]